MFSLSKSVSKLKSLSKNNSFDKSGENLTNGRKIKKKKTKKVAKPEAKQLSTGVVSISNIPHGFYEKEMSAYFSQFGKVLRLRISKNPKTGKRRNYGFIEFECEEVAKIVADTMNNYLMFDHIIKCEFIPKEKLKEKQKLFKNWDKEFVGSTLIHKSLHNKNKSIEREFKLMRKRLRNVRQMETVLKQKGLDFKCEVINLPDISKLRQQNNLESKESPKTPKTVSLKVSKIAKQKSLLKTPKLETPKRHTLETIYISSKSTEKKRKSLKTPVYPRLLKYSILLSANKKRVL